MIRRLFKLSVIGVVGLIALIGVCYAAVSINASGKTYDYDDVESVPFNDVGMLLGTSPYTRAGVHNYYFDFRIRAAARLYHAGKVKRIVASGGDYSDTPNGYDELVAMRDSLVNHGVPDSVITLDYQGTRTAKSIEYAKSQGFDKMTIISQSYHNDRAIWLAEHYGLEVVAYDAETPARRKSRVKNYCRECLSRVKMFYDLLTE